FSSRRRHTRFSRDWSSDVCSSDLAAPGWSQRGTGGGWAAPRGARGGPAWGLERGRVGRPLARGLLPGGGSALLAVALLPVLALGLRHGRGRGPQGGADLFDVDLEDGALLALLGLIRPL